MEAMSPSFLDKLDLAREIAGTAFHLRSAVRCMPHNLVEGGNEGSAHPRGFAVDVEAENSRQRYHVVRGMIQAGIHRIGVNYKKGFVHGDDDPTKEPEVMFPYD